MSTDFLARKGESLLVICPVQTRFEKYFLLSFDPNHRPIARIPFQERGVGHRHERWDGMRWTRDWFSQGGFPVSDQTACRRTALKRLG
jgi:hypothetical protein